MSCMNKKKQLHQQSVSSADMMLLCSAALFFDLFDLNVGHPLTEKEINWQQLFNFQRKFNRDENKNDDAETSFNLLFRMLCVLASTENDDTVFFQIFKNKSQPFFNSVRDFL